MDKKNRLYVLRFSRKTDQEILSFFFLFITYIVSKSFIAILIGVFILLFIVILEWKKKIEFYDQEIIFKDTIFGSERAVSYSDLQKVEIEKIYTTSQFYNMIFRFTFLVGTIKKIVKIGVYDNTTGGKIVQILKRKNIEYSYSDQYIKMILEKKSLD